MAQNKEILFNTALLWLVSQPAWHSPVQIYVANFHHALILKNIEKDRINLCGSNLTYNYTDSFYLSWFHCVSRRNRPYKSESPLKPEKARLTKKERTNNCKWAAFSFLKVYDKSEFHLPKANPTSYYFQWLAGCSYTSRIPTIPTHFIISALFL